MKTTHKILILTGSVFLLLLLMGAGMFLAVRQEETDGLVPITLEEFEQYVHTADTSRGEAFYIYVGRDDCPDCAKVHPDICKLASEEDLDILYYSTSQDRETRQERMSALLEEVKVDSVPTVLEFTGGQLSSSYSGEEFVAAKKESN